jgi:TetR/AcrR family tetracycline transcriptional repressor
MKLDRSKILDVALELLNEVGIDALSTRLLAERLGVKQPALYWHFQNRRDLLAAMNSEILARGRRRAPRAGEDWRNFFLSNTRCFRNALLAYRDGGRIHADAEARPEKIGRLQRDLRLFVKTGIASGVAMELLVAAGRYTVGCVLEEQADALEGAPDKRQPQAGKATPPGKAQILSCYSPRGHAALFEAGLELMANGASVRLGEFLPLATPANHPAALIAGGGTVRVKH